MVTMTEVEAPLDIERELVVSETIMRMSFETEDFHDLPDSNADRNHRIEGVYGEAASTLSLLDRDTVQVDEVTRRIRKGSRTYRGVLDLAMQYPDIWVPLSDIDRVATGSAPHNALATINRQFRRPVIVTRKHDNRVFMRLAADLRLVDKRPQPEEILSPKPVNKSVAQAFRLPNLGKTGNLVVDDVGLLDATHPWRYVRILNIPEVNEQAADLQAFRARKYPDRPIAPLATFSFMDDTHAEHRQVPFDYGPFARTIFHALLKKYLTPEYVSFPYQDIVKETGDFRSQQVKMQELLRSMALRQMVSVERRTENGLVLITKARLNPVLFDDRRLPYPSLEPADS